MLLYLYFCFCFCFFFILLQRHHCHPASTSIFPFFVNQVFHPYRPHTIDPPIHHPYAYVDPSLELSAVSLSLQSQFQPPIDIHSHVPRTNSRHGVDLQAHQIHRHHHRFEKLATRALPKVAVEEGFGSRLASRDPVHGPRSTAQREALRPNPTATVNDPTEVGAGMAGSSVYVVGGENILIKAIFWRHVVMSPLVFMKSSSNLASPVRISIQYRSQASFHRRQHLSRT